MRFERICLSFLIFSIAACGRSAENSRSIQNSEPNDADPALRETTLSTLGGTASSPDGIFSVLITESTFEEEVTVVIEKLPESTTGEPTRLTSTYRLRFEPEEIALSEGKLLQVRFALEPETVESVGQDNIKIKYRTDTTGSLDNELISRLEENRVWATTRVLFADFGLINDAASSGTCECDLDENCTPTCDCDADCDGNLGGDGTTEGGCNAAEFSCESTEQCIPLIYVCDGDSQCADASDEAEELCGGTTGVTGDAFEPDNSFDSSSTATLSQTQSRTLTAGDMDVVRFEVELRQDVTVLVTSQSLMDSRINLQLYNSSQEELANSGVVNGGFVEEGGPVKLRRVLDAGTYFVVASPLGGQSTINYELSVTASTPLPDGPQELQGEQVGAKVVLTWDAVQGCDSYRVYYSDLPIGENSTSSWFEAMEGPSPILTSATALDITGLPELESVYFVVVAIFDGVETYPSNQISLSVSLAPDAYEHDNTFETASLLHSNPIVDGSFSQLHSSHEPGDLDYVKFDLIGLDNTVVISTSGTNYSDTKVALYSASRELIAENDNNETNVGDYYSRLEVSGLSPGTYFVLTRGASDWDVFGGYNLTVTVTSSGVEVVEPDRFETDDTLESVRGLVENQLSVEVSQSRSIHNQSDVDFTHFELLTTSDVVVTTTGEAGDTILEVLNDAGDSLGEDRSPGGFSRVHIANLSPGTYFAKVSGQGTPATIASYQLTLRVFEKPEAPRNVRITPAAGELIIAWDSVGSATGYRIFYSYSNNALDSVTSAEEGASPLDALHSPATLSGLPTDAPTSVCVKAINQIALSDCSSVVQATPLDP